MTPPPAPRQEHYNECFRADYLGPKLLFAGTVEWVRDGPEEYAVCGSRAELLEDFTPHVRAMYGLSRNWGNRLHMISELLDARHMGTKFHMEFDNPWPATAAEGHRCYTAIGLDAVGMGLAINCSPQFSLAFDGPRTPDTELRCAIHTVALAEVAAAVAVA